MLVDVPLDYSTGCTPIRIEGLAGVEDIWNDRDTSATTDLTILACCQAFRDTSETQGIAPSALLFLHVVNLDVTIQLDARTRVLFFVLLQVQLLDLSEKCAPHTIKLVDFCPELLNAGLASIHHEDSWFRGTMMLYRPRSRTSRAWSSLASMGIFMDSVGRWSFLMAAGIAGTVILSW
jgi:hypothetical protein